MRRALILALCCLLFAGCATRGSKPSAQSGDSSAPTDSTRTIPGPVQVVGRVIAVDLSSLSVVIDLAPYAVLPAGFAGQTLIARRLDLAPTARMQASPYLRGRTLGARLLAGRPQIGDEVVFAPPTP